MIQSWEQLNYDEILRKKLNWGAAWQIPLSGSVPLIRDEAAILPLNLPRTARIAVTLPVCRQQLQAIPILRPPLAYVLRRYHPYVDEFIVHQVPTESDIATFRRRVLRYDLLLLMTLDAAHHPTQADFVNALLATAVPAITIAFCSPDDLATYSQTRTHIQVETDQPGAFQMVTAVLWGNNFLHQELAIGQDQPIQHR